MELEGPYLANSEKLELATSACQWLKPRLGSAPIWDFLLLTYKWIQFWCSWHDFHGYKEDYIRRQSKWRTRAHYRELKRATYKEFMIILNFIDGEERTIPRLWKIFMIEDCIILSCRLAQVMTKFVTRINRKNLKFNLIWNCSLYLILVIELIIYYFLISFSYLITIDTCLLLILLQG